jgi:hypothetical protein
MGRIPDTAPPGLFTLADAARITDLDRRRITYWCAPWGAGLVKPLLDPRTKGGTKLLSEHDLVKLAVIPKLLEAGADHELIAAMFKKAESKWWDLSQAKAENENWLDWIVLIWDWHFRPTWSLLAGAYASGPGGSVGKGALDGLGGILNGFIYRRGPIRGFQVIEMSNLKREILERLK